MGKSFLFLWQVLTQPRLALNSLGNKNDSEWLILMPLLIDLWHYGGGVTTPQKNSTDIRLLIETCAKKKKSKTSWKIPEPLWIMSDTLMERKQGSLLKSLSPGASATYLFPSTFFCLSSPHLDLYKDLFFKNSNCFLKGKRKNCWQSWDLWHGETGTCLLPQYSYGEWLEEAETGESAGSSPFLEKLINEWINNKYINDRQMNK